MTDTIREALERVLFSNESSVPGSTLGRLGRAASTAMQGGRLIVEDRVRRIINRPVTLDAEALEPIVLSLGELKAVAMKIGQLASYMNPEIRPELRDALSALQTHSQPLPFDHVVHTVRDELGAAGDALLATMEPTPVAAGSIGQVHRAETAQGRQVAVKVQYPGIRDAIERDFGPASMAARALGLFYPTARLDLFGAEVCERLLAECDYESEARNQRRMRENFADTPDVVIPRVYGELSGQKVLTSEWIDGVHLDRFLAQGPSQELRDRAGTAIYSFYYGSIFRFGLYNADPHPGNTLFLPDGRTAMVDFGAAHAFAPELVRELAALTHAIHCKHEGLMHDALVGLGLVTESQKYDRGGAQELMGSLFGAMLHDDSRAVDLSSARFSLRARQLLKKITVPGEFLFLYRVRVGVLAVLAELGARANWYRHERRTVDRASLGVPRERRAPAADLDVVLVDSGPRKVRVVRELRDITGDSLRRLKDRVDAPPYVLGTRLGRDDARALETRLREVGAKVEVRESAPG